MNKLATFSLIRSVLIAGGTWAVSTGQLGQDLMEQIIPAVLAILAAAWGVGEKIQKGS
jgi:hypothetical protein